MAAEFVGAQPPVAVERFLDDLLPSEADALVAAGRRGVVASRARARADARRRGCRPTRAFCTSGARPTRRWRCSVACCGSFAADGLAARIKLEQAGANGLGDAFAALDAGDQERGLDLLIDALPDADGAREDIRRVVVGVLDELGVEHPLARAARRKLAAALY